MAKKMLTVSDLTGQPVTNDEDVVTIIVHDHPNIEEPVQLDAAKDELKTVAGSKKDFVLIELVSDGGDTRERLVLETAKFDKLFGGDAAEVLAEAEHYDYGGKYQQPEPAAKRRGRPRGSSTASTGSAAPKVDYKTIENAGRVHRGRITEEEKLQVQQNFDKVVENLKKLGERELDLTNAEHVQKYDLFKLAGDRGIVPK